MNVSPGCISAKKTSALADELELDRFVDFRINDSERVGKHGRRIGLGLRFGRRRHRGLLCERQYHKRYGAPSNGVAAVGNPKMWFDQPLNVGAYWPRPSRL